MKIEDVKVGDMVVSSDGKPIKVIDVVKKYVPNRMFRMKFDNGFVECSDNHLWKVYLDTGESAVLRTDEFISMKDARKFYFGKMGGPRLLSIKEIKPKEVCCIRVDSEDQLFEIVLKPNKLHAKSKADRKILTHNCQFRMACGRLGQIASMMLFGNTMATTINGSHHGAGMISANGSIQSIQYYFEDIKWIKDFYKKAGFDETGHRTAPSKTKTKTVNFEKNDSERLPNEDDSENPSNSYDSENNVYDVDNFNFDDMDFDNDDKSDSSDDTEGAEDVEKYDANTNSKGHMNHDSKGHGKSDLEEFEGSNHSAEDNDDESNSDFDDELNNLFNFEHDIETIEIEGITGRVDKTKRQKFE